MYVIKTNKIFSHIRFILNQNTRSVSPSTMKDIYNKNKCIILLMFYFYSVSYAFTVPADCNISDVITVFESFSFCAVGSIYSII